jgi:N-acetylmuramoyl-L-alanine amidase
MKHAAPAILLFLLAAVLAVAQYRDLNQVLDELGATLAWDPLTEQGHLDLSGGTLGRKGDRVTFKVGFPWVLVNYRRQVYCPGIVRRDGALLFPEQGLENLVRFFQTASESAEQPRVAVILIDPGHGGSDAGAVGCFVENKEQRRIQEKEVVLEVSRRLNALLVQAFPDKNIMLTRSEDLYLTLEQRAALANDITLGEHEAILFLSLHANASFNSTARGYEVWVLPDEYRRELIDSSALDEEQRAIAPILNVLLEEEYSIESITLARSVLDSFDREIGELSVNRGIREESWFVVRKAKMPSILIELGFVTNPEEARLLAQEAYLQKLAQGIYTGVLRFVHAFEQSKGFTE